MQIPPSGTLCLLPLGNPTKLYPLEDSSTLSSCPSSAAKPLSLREVVGIFSLGPDFSDMFEVSPAR